jgi:ribosomal protein S18 acetylase RimI-like enzyme
VAITATISLARRIDGTEFRLVAGLAEASRAAGDEVSMVPIGGVASVLAEAGSPFNKVIGLGLGDVVDVAALEEVERHHASRQAPIQVELATLADPELARRLTARGYWLSGFENVLGLDLASGRAPCATPAGVAVTKAADDDDRARWIQAVTAAFLTPDVFDGPPPHETFEREVLQRAYQRFAAVPGSLQVLAWLDGEVAGGGSLFVHDGVALLCGAATLPSFRRRGVQTTLLETRLSHARAAGCDLAVVTTQLGSKSQANVQRFGFELLYSRAILRKDPG